MVKKIHKAFVRAQHYMSVVLVTGIIILNQKLIWKAHGYLEEKDIKMSYFNTSRNHAF